MFDNQSVSILDNLTPSAIQSLDIPYSKNRVLSQQNLIDYVEKNLALLEDDWDGYGACSIDRNVIAHTSALFNQLPNVLLENLHKEAILPTPNGTITIEWHKDSSELLLEVGSDLSTYYIQNQGNTQVINNKFDISDQKQMQTFIKELKLYIFN